MRRGKLYSTWKKNRNLVIALYVVIGWSFSMAARPPPVSVFRSSFAFARGARGSPVQYHSLPTSIGFPHPLSPLLSASLGSWLIKRCGSSRPHRNHQTMLVSALIAGSIVDSKAAEEAAAPLNLSKEGGKARRLLQRFKRRQQRFEQAQSEQSAATMDVGLLANDKPRFLQETDYEYYCPRKLLPRFSETASSGLGCRVIMVYHDLN